MEVNALCVRNRTMETLPHIPPTATADIGNACESDFRTADCKPFSPTRCWNCCLFYALPRVNTNPIAHDLMAEFHSLSGVLDADIEDLKRIDGIGENAAVLLKLIPQLCQMYQLDKMSDSDVMDTLPKLCNYLKAWFSGVISEQVVLLCLNESLQLIRSEVIGDGTTQEVFLDAHRIASCAIRLRCTRVVLAHNHPNASAALTDADIFSTNQLRNILNGLQIVLLDHIVVGKYGDTVSMRQLMGWS